MVNGWLDGPSRSPNWFSKHKTEILRKVKAVMGPTFELDAISSDVIIEQKCKIKRLMRVVRFVWWVLVFHFEYYWVWEFRNEVG